MKAAQPGTWRDDWRLDGFGEPRNDGLHAVPEEIKTSLNGLSLAGTSLIERYVVGDLAVQLDLAFAADSDRPSHKLRAVLHWPLRSDLCALDRDSTIRIQREMAKAKRCADEIERAVLVGVAELVKNPKNVPFGFAPAVIKGLDAGDALAGGVVKTTGLPQPAGTIRIPKLRLVFEDGEFRPVGRVSPIWGAEGIDGMIQSGPEPVDDLADDNAPLQGRLSLDMDVADLLSGLSIYIEREFVGLIIKPPFDRSLKSARMMVGPVDLEASAR